MITPGFNIWNDIPVFAIDYRLEVTQREAFKSGLTSSPVMAFVAKNGTATNYNAFHAQCSAEHIKSLAGKMVDGVPFIAAAIPAIETLTEKELQAIFWHEKSHIDHGDLDRVGAGEVLCDHEAEIRADKLAIEMIGGEHLKSAMYKMHRFTARFISENHPYDFEETLEKFNSDPEFLERVAKMS